MINPDTYQADTTSPGYLKFSSEADAKSLPNLGDPAVLVQIYKQKALPFADQVNSWVTWLAAGETEEPVKKRGRPAGKSGATKPSAPKLSQAVAAMEEVLHVLRCNLWRMSVFCHSSVYWWFPGCWWQALCAIFLKKGGGMIHLSISGDYAENCLGWTWGARGQCQGCGSRTKGGCWKKGETISCCLLSRRKGLLELNNEQQLYM